MIHYVKGDILHSTCQAVAHGVAPNDDFKQGLALSLRERYPALYKDFRHYCKTTHPKEGTLWSWKTAGSPYYINLFTQQHPESQGATPGRAHLSYVGSSLKALAKLVEEEKFQTIAITKLATGVGGLPWSEVKPMIETYLKSMKAELFVYEEYAPGLAAKEI